ncbi:hypothetical protein HY374_03580 [Candidatus Berkelbacteria bacterium]|nr:hypothetical protein [Candidatus Berkelbacteria bacterium]
MRSRLAWSSNTLWAVGGVVAVAALALPDSAQAAVFNLERADIVIMHANNVQLWEFFRSLVNWVLVAALIGVAFANVFRLNIDSYAIKKILPNLLIGFVLANFSLLITRSILEVAESLTRTADYITVQSTGKSLGEAFFGTFSGILDVKNVAAVIAGLAGAAIFGGGFGLIIGLLGIGLILIFPIIAQIALFAIFIVRNYVLQFLVALSPLAFIAMATPMTQPLFKQWWKQFATWTFMKPIGLLLLSLGALIVSSGVGGYFVSYVVALVVMFFAVTIPFKAGGIINATVGKVTGGLGSMFARGGYNRAMDSNWMKNSRPGRFLGRYISRATGGYEAFKQQEERRAERVKRGTFAAAADERATRERVGQHRLALLGPRFLGGEGWNRDSLRRFGEVGRGLMPFARPEVARLGRPESRTYQSMARAAAVAEEQKVLPGDFDAWVEELSLGDLPEERREALLQKISSSGRNYDFIKAISGEILATTHGSREREELLRKYGLRSGTADADLQAGVLYQDANRMMSIFTALLSSNRQIRDDLHRNGHTALESVSPEQNQTLMQQLGQISEASYQAGDHHLGKMIDKPSVGAPTRLNIYDPTTGAVDWNKRFGDLATRLFSSESQKVATSLNEYTFVTTDPAGRHVMNGQLGAALAAHRKATALSPHGARMDPEAREAFNNAGVRIP